MVERETGLSVIWDPGAAGFLSEMERLHAATLVNRAVNGDLSFSEWLFDYSLKGGERQQLAEVAVRTWRDGKVTRERFFYQGE